MRLGVLAEQDIHLVRLPDRDRRRQVVLVSQDEEVLDAHLLLVKR